MKSRNLDFIPQKSLKLYYHFGVYTKSGKYPMLLLGYMFFATLIIYILSRTYFGINFINAFVMIYIYPFAFLGIVPQFYKKHGLIFATIIFLSFAAICYLVCDTKMLLFSMVMFVVSEFLAIKFVTPPKSKHWYKHACGIATLVILFFLSIIIIEWSVLSRRILGFLNPETVLEYDMLLQWLRSCDFISFNPNKSFVTDINCMTACPYAHIMTCFGIFPTFAFIGIQTFMAFCMFKNASSFMNIQRKLLGIISAIMVWFHLALSVFSSFYVIPMIGYGGPLVLTTGMYFSYIPILLYFYLECIEYYKAKIKKLFIRKHLQTMEGLKLKKMWNETSIKNLILLFNRLSEGKLQFKIENSDKLNTIVRFDSENNKLIYSKAICNDAFLPDFVVISALAFIYSAIKLDLQSYNNISQVRNYAVNLCDDIGSKYVSEDECEEYIRPVRRKHFPDPLNGGCYFKVGDIIRQRPGSGFAPRCTITAISPLTENGIMISYKLYNSEIIRTLEEKEVYQDYIITYETEVEQ